MSHSNGEPMVKPHDDTSPTIDVSPMDHSKVEWTLHIGALNINDSEQPLVKAMKASTCSLLALLVKDHYLILAGAPMPGDLSGQLSYCPATKVPGLGKKDLKVSENVCSHPSAHAPATLVLSDVAHSIMSVMEGHYTHVNGLKKKVQKGGLVFCCKAWEVKVLFSKIMDNWYINFIKKLDAFIAKGKATSEQLAAFFIGPEGLAQESELMDFIYELLGGKGRNGLFAWKEKEYAKTEDPVAQNTPSNSTKIPKEMADMFAWIEVFGKKIEEKTAKMDSVCDRSFAMISASDNDRISGRRW